MSEGRDKARLPQSPEPRSRLKALLLWLCWTFYLGVVGACLHIAGLPIAFLYPTWAIAALLATLGFLELYRGMRGKPGRRIRAVILWLLLAIPFLPGSFLSLSFSMMGIAYQAWALAILAASFGLLGLYAFARAGWRVYALHWRRGAQA